MGVPEKTSLLFGGRLATKLLHWGRTSRLSGPVLCPFIDQISGD